MRTLEEQLGQLLIVALDEDYDTTGGQREMEDFLRRIHPGGVIFFQRNIKTAPSFLALVEQVRELLDPPPFLALDLEGGLVDRLREVLAPLPAVEDVARAGLGFEMGRLAGRELAAFSLNVDFAPVLDLGAPESRKVLGNRTAGATPGEVIRFAQSFLKGLAEANIVGCGKHFPGLGSGQTDSHKEMPWVEKTEQQMWEEDMLPYRRLARELPMVMAAHVHCPGLEGDARASGSSAAPPLPATLSRRIISGLLKERIGFQGLAICDDLEMGGALEGRSMVEAAVASLQAGCDILLFCGPAANTRKAFESLLQAAASNAQFRGVVEQTAQRVLEAKSRLRIAARQPSKTLPDFDVLRSEIQAFSAAVKSAHPQKG